MFKHWCIVIDVQQADGDPTVGCLQPVISQNHQLDVTTQLKVQRVISLYPDFTCTRSKIEGKEQKYKHLKRDTSLHYLHINPR